MILAAAQTSPVRFNTEKNIEEHIFWIKKAAKKNADLIVFPEMSLTGYERKEAASLAFSLTDSRLDKLKTCSENYNIIVVAGAPVKMASKLFIGSFILFPNGKTSIYTKQFLHNGEELFFSSSFEFNPRIELENEKISLAICADITHEIHAGNAKNNQTTIYIPSIFFTNSGIYEGHQTLQKYAKKYAMNILMSNFSGTSYEKESGGKSAFWNKNGELIGELNSTDSGLLIVQKEDEKWNSEVIHK